MEDSEPYPIKVLHIINPHLVFIESEIDKTPVIEQVGLYALLPVNKTIDIDGQVLTEKTENWPIAANTILRELFASNQASVYFIPMHDHERLTIFDENIHKFGDIIIQSRKTMSVSDHLIKSAVAIKDETSFLQKLSSGSLKLKLNTARTEEVLNAIKKYYKTQKKVTHDWQKTIEKQTSYHQESKKITAALTQENLKLFDRATTPGNFMAETIEKKEKDIEYYKDADMVALGRGLKRHSRPASDALSKSNYTKDSPESLLKDVKKFLDIHGKKKVSVSSQQNVSNKHTELEDEWDDIADFNFMIDSNKTNLKPEFQQYSNECDKDLVKNEMKKCSQRDTHNDEENIKNTTDGDDFAENIQHKVLLKSNKMSPNTKERRIIYCPDMELSSTNLKNLIPKTVSEDSPANFANSIDTFNNVGEKKTPLDDTIDSNLIHEDKASKNTARSSIKLKTIANSKECRIRATIMQEKILSFRMAEHRKRFALAKSGQTDSSPNTDNMSVKTDNNEATSKVDDMIPKNTSQKLINEKGKSTKSILSSSVLRSKLELLRNKQKKIADSTSSTSDTSVKDTSSSNEPSKVELKLSEQNVSKPKSKTDTKTESQQQGNPDLNPSLPGLLPTNTVERNVDPFKNLDGSKSVFVEKLISPTLMVHTKNDNLVLPKCELSEVPFKTDIRMMLKALRIQRPKRLQTVSWGCILRGHSVFMIGPAGNGKTLGYVPAVCNLIADARTQLEGIGPICIIVCATALSVSEVEKLCKKFLSNEDKIVSFYCGIDQGKVTTELLNGCNVLICTAPALVVLLETDFGVDLRRLAIIVYEDCERLSQVYGSELHKITQNVNLMLRNRADKAFKVQHIVASRHWCDFLTPLAKKAPDTVIAIGATQESVLYSKTYTSVNIVNSDEKKMDAVLEFLEQNDFSKRTVIVCREDEEVDLLAAALRNMRYTVFSCNSSMDIHDLYKLSETWANYTEPISGPILVCCDGNLAHLNITNAHYLIQYSLPPLFTTFCKRFLVLNENFASIFIAEKPDVKIKILMDKTNVEQLPKILNFVKRCTDEPLPSLDDVLQDVIKKKDLIKAQGLTPICNNLLMLGECLDIWTCSDRHTVFQDIDVSEEWMPKRGVVTFKITHFDSAVTYSARLLTQTGNGDREKFPNNVNKLALKMGMYYSKEANRRPHGPPKVGDICAVASNQSLFERCKVMKVIPSESKNMYHVLIKLIDKEQMTMTSDVELYYLPEELKRIETYMIKVRLANLQPKDRDVTFSVAAKEHLQKLIELDRDDGWYIKGKVAMALGNCIFVDSAEICVDLSSLGETVVKRDFKKELLGIHAEPNPQHIEKLKKLCGIVENTECDEKTHVMKQQKCPNWAHFDRDDFSTVVVSVMDDPNKFILRNTKFQKIMKELQNEIQCYVENAPKLDSKEIYVGNIVLAEFCDDSYYERVRIDKIIDAEKVECFSVDNGDWRTVSVEKLKPITDNILQRIPCQAIECRLIGIQPPSDQVWPEFSICWLEQICFDNEDGKQKELFAKCFTKEPATVTGGHKYGIVLIDTSSDQDVVINKRMLELNLAKEIKDEKKYLHEFYNLPSLKNTDSSSDDLNIIIATDSKGATEADSTIKDLVTTYNSKNVEHTTNKNPMNMLFEKPIRSVPLVNSDSDSDDLDKWDVNVDKEMIALFGQSSKTCQTTFQNNVHKEDSKYTNCDVLEKSSAVSEIDIPKNNETRVTGTKIEVISSSDKSMDKTTLTYRKASSLDSDDDEKNKILDEFTNKLSKNNEKNTKNQDKSNNTLDSDDFSSKDNSCLEKSSSNLALDTETFRKPKLVWRQNKSTVSLKINLIGVEDYKLDIKENDIKFETWHNDTKYEFELELYGAISPLKCVHLNKGQYILVRLAKMLPRKWLNLTKGFSAKKWISYDVDAIEFSSDDNDDGDDESVVRKVIKYNHEKVESASEDEDHFDDVNFIYKK